MVGIPVRVIRGVMSLVGGDYRIQISNSGGDRWEDYESVYQFLQSTEDEAKFPRDEGMTISYGGGNDPVVEVRIVGQDHVGIIVDPDLGDED